MEHWEPDESEVPPDVEYPFVVCAHKFKKEVSTLKEAEAITRNLVYQGKRVEILYDDVVVGKARETQDGFLSWEIHPNGIHREVISEPKQKLTGGKRMAGKWELVIGGRTRRSFLDFETKVSALADIYLKGKSAEQVVGNLYKQADREAPKNLSIVVANWKKSLQDKLDKDDPYTIEICQKYGLVREKGEASEEEYEEEPEAEEAEEPTPPPAPVKKAGRPPFRK